MISEKAVQEFRDLYKAEFGIELSLEEATDKANNLIGLYKVVLGDEKPGR
jgi:hypothetical protein